MAFKWISDICMFLIMRYIPLQGPMHLGLPLVQVQICFAQKQTVQFECCITFILIKQIAVL